MFVSHYDAGAYQYFTSLKAFHIKFFEDNKSAKEGVFDEQKAKTTCDSGELKFREETEYALGKQMTPVLKRLATSTTSSKTTARWL